MLGVPESNLLSGDGAQGLVHAKHVLYKAMFVELKLRLSWTELISLRGEPPTVKELILSQSSGVRQDTFSTYPLTGCDCFLVEPRENFLFYSRPFSGHSWVITLHCQVAVLLAKR